MKVSIRRDPYYAINLEGERCHACGQDAIDRVKTSPYGYLYFCSDHLLVRLAS